MQEVVLPCQGYRNHSVCCQTWKHWTCFIRHFGLRNGRTSEGFWGSKKSCILWSRWLFFLVKVTGIIRSVAKLGNIVPLSLWPTSKPTYIYWCGLMNLRYVNITDSWVEELPKDFGNLESLAFFKACGCSSLSRLSGLFGQLPNLERVNIARCGKLQSLLKSIGGLTNLRVLDISGSSRV